MNGPFADRLFRIAFALAGCYNLAFGLWAALWPLAFFHVFQIPPPRYPAIWGCLGMVVGLYGLLYWHSAWKLETAWPIIAVGLLGKVLGPIGMAMSFSDAWPRRLGMLCIFNDLIWWLPFGLFLIRGTQFGRRVASLAPWLCLAVHVLAILMLAVYLQPGTVIGNSDAAARGQYIASHVSAWTIGWSAWGLAAMGLVGFYAWWASRLVAVGQTSLSANGVSLPHVRTVFALLAVMLAAFGMIFDLSGEGALILPLVERAPKSFAALGDWNSSPFIGAERAFTLLSAGAANSLYAIAGILLTLITPDVPNWVRAAMWLTWLASIGMTVAAVANYTPGLVVATILLFPPFLTYVVWMAARWSRR